MNYRWTGLNELASLLGNHWSDMTYIRLAMLEPGKQSQRDGAETYRLDLSPESISAELEGYFADGVDLEGPEREQLIHATMEWVKAKALAMTEQYLPPASFCVYLGGTHPKKKTKCDLTTARLRVDLLSTPQFTSAPTNSPPPTPPPLSSLMGEGNMEDGAAADFVRNAKNLMMLSEAFTRNVVSNASTLSNEILNRATQALTLQQTITANLQQQNEVLQAKVLESSARLFQRADEQQQRSAEERRELFEQQAEERKAAIRMEMGKQIVHQLGALGQTYLGGKAVPPELLELLPILPPEVFEALTDRDVIEALKNNAELRDLVKEMVVNVRDSVKAGKAKAEKEAREQNSGEPPKAESSEK